jgi:integrase
LAQDHPRQAGLVLNYLKQLFVWAEDREIIDASPVATLTASKIGTGLTPAARSRVLAEPEIKALWGLTQPPNGMQTVTLSALQMILLSGQRPGEVSGMQWDEIKGDTWIIPPERRGKTKDAHAVPLTETAQGLLHRAGATGAYVFSARDGRPIGATAVARAVRRCGHCMGSETPLWRPHDLRRTMRTGLAAIGIPEHIAELTIGHVRQGIAAVYDQHRYDAEKRAALEAWETRLLGIAG